MNYNVDMKQYETPVFSRPITSPDFKSYISKPRRRRFHDSQIWPERYQKYTLNIYAEKLNYRKQCIKNRIFSWSSKRRVTPI